ncbi:hypothetical protein F5883DRAFT_636935 [Diaporthe sp. PMI_573]|nr:hypothetical protein F5883DRAFT_636935 [Diaporthaceae sp. PMI_573]
MSPKGTLSSTTKPAGQKTPPNKAAARKPADTPPPNAAAGRGTLPGGSNTESWHLSNFSFYLCGPGKSEVAYEADSDEFRLVADAYHIGLQLFNREDSKSALVSLARSCADAWTSPLNRKKYQEYTWQGEKSKLGHYLDVFRRGITYTPPTIYNDPELGPGLYGVTIREAGYSMNYEKLLTRELFRISINSQLVSNIKDAFAKHEEDRYQELRMVLAVTFFHELTHGFVNFLIGDIGKASVRTPPDCSAIWEDVATVLNGESGYFVEGEVAGGSLEIRPFPSDRNKRGMLVARCEDDVLHEVTIDVVKGLLKAPKVKMLYHGNDSAYL